MNALGPAVLSSAALDSYPSLCINMGLTCEDCTTESARHLAKTCRGLRGPSVRQLFVQIYPDPACSAMAARFEKSYQEASTMLAAGPILRETKAAAAGMA